MEIKDLQIDGNTFLAPLAGITNLPFRRLVKECGCAVVCSEMVSAKGIFFNSEKTLALMKSMESEKPLSIQLFGSDPVSMADAARVVQDLNVADLIDINFGCSVRKVVKQGAGVALMKEPALTEKILTGLRSATDLPLTIKIRSGWDESGHQAFHIAAIAQDCGVDAVTLHPRTASQGFRGCADWDHIKILKSKLSIPVIGNGDINTVEDAQKMFEQTQCDAVMVGRAALGNPFILSQIEQFLKTGSYSSPLPAQLFDKMKHLVHFYVDYFGEPVACKMLRGRLSWFVKGFPKASEFRKNLSQIESKNHALDLIREFEITL